MIAAAQVTGSGFTAEAAASETTIVSPTGDAYVSALEPRRNFGTQGAMALDGSPIKRP